MPISESLWLRQTQSLTQRPQLFFSITMIYRVNLQVDLRAPRTKEVGWVLRCSLLSWIASCPTDSAYPRDSKREQTPQPRWQWHSTQWGLWLPHPLFLSLSRERLLPCTAYTNGRQAMLSEESSPRLELSEGTWGAWLCCTCSKVLLAQHGTPNPLLTLLSRKLHLGRERVRVPSLQQIP